MLKLDERTDLKMLAPQSLRRPSNWQDFESLCKKLWGEIWNCPEIKKHGRTGQGQQGVDVFGIPEGADAHYGIQCKGKDEYSEKQFTEQEITTEIAKALTFTPPLKKLYFATTAVKDATIEAFVRQKDIEHRLAGLFEVHLYCWEDIVDLIDENKGTHDWYVRNQNYKTRYQTKLTFEKQLTEITLSPKFLQYRTIYRYPQPERNFSPGLTSYDSILKAATAYQRMVPGQIVMRNKLSSVKVNRSFVPIDLWFYNLGTDTLEDYKIYLTFEGDIVDMAKENKTGGILRTILPNNYVPTTRVYADTFQVSLIPRNNVLVPGDHFGPEIFYIKPAIDCAIITINYKVLSRQYQDDGSLKVHLNSNIDYKNKYIDVDNEADERTEYYEVEDVIEYEDDI